MPSANNIQRFTRLSLFVTMALVLSYMERFLPILPAFPGIKLGLANIITFIVLIMYSWKDAFFVLIARVTLLSFFSAGGISFLYSMSGGLMSLMAMTFAHKYLGNTFSLIGISVIGAFMHNTAQMLVLAAVLRSFFIPLSYYPILVFSAVLTGILTGFVVMHLHAHLKRLGQK